MCIIVVSNNWTLLDLTLQCWWSVRCCVYYSSQQQQLDTVCGLLDLTLLWQTLLCSFFILITWSLTAVLYRVYHTQVQHNVSHQFSLFYSFMVWFMLNLQRCVHVHRYIWHHSFTVQKTVYTKSTTQLHLASLFHGSLKYIWHHCLTVTLYTKSDLFGITFLPSVCLPNLLHTGTFGGTLGPHCLVVLYVQQPTNLTGHSTGETIIELNL